MAMKQLSMITLALKEVVEGSEISTPSQENVLPTLESQVVSDFTFLMGVTPTSIIKKYFRAVTS